MAGNEVWNFIKTNKATLAAPLKVLQEFVLSLERDELQNMIEGYLKSVYMTKQNRIDGLTPKQTVSRMVYNEGFCACVAKRRNNASILSKMNCFYEKQFDKQIIKKLQQNNVENKHILSINPEILSYSFQFLTFRELCKIQTTCAYFPYLNQAYPALSHGFINLDHAFWKSTIKNKINVYHLKHFKHVKIAYAYYSNRDTRSLRCLQIFEHVLKLIILRSNRLKTLEINVRKYCGEYNVGPMLVHVMQLRVFPVSRLLWMNDVVRNYLGVYNYISWEIDSKFPNVQHLSFGLKWRIPPGIHRRRLTGHPRSMFKALKPIMAQLTSLDIKCVNYNMFHSDSQMLLVLKEAVKLRELEISTYVIGNEELGDLMTVQIDNILLDTLILEIIINDKDRSSGSGGPVIVYRFKEIISRILEKVLCAYSGINHFEFGFGRRYSFEINSYRGIDFGIDWFHLLYSLLEEKMQKRLKMSICPLRTIKFNEMSHNDGIDGLRALESCLHHEMLDLEDFCINIVYGDDAVLTQMKYAQFINDHIIPFMNLPRNKETLQHIELAYGNLQKHSGRWESRKPQMINASALYMGPVFRHQ